MSGETQLRLTAVGPAAAGLALADLQSLVDAALIQLFGVIGGGSIPYTFESASSTAGILRLDKRDEPKLRQALALLSSHNSKPLRIDIA